MTQFIYVSLQQYWTDIIQTEFADTRGLVLPIPISIYHTVYSQYIPPVFLFSTPLTRRLVVIDNPGN